MKLPCLIVGHIVPTVVEDQASATRAPASLSFIVDPSLLTPAD